MSTSYLLNDYEQFAAFFQSLETTEDCPEPADLEEILDSLHDEENSL